MENKLTIRDRFIQRLRYRLWEHRVYKQAAKRKFIMIIDEVCTAEAEIILAGGKAITE